MVIAKINGRIKKISNKRFHATKKLFRDVKNSGYYTACPNAGKYGPGKLQIRTRFMQLVLSNTEEI